VLFVDIRGYTSLTEQMTPADMVSQLNRFYQLASDAIFRRDGTLDKLVGDQVMAFFGAPVERGDHARRAVETAAEIMREVANPARQLALRVGAGIGSGEAFVGNVGGTDVTDYTVLGDIVNIAARLQSEAAAGEILISDETYASVPHVFSDARKRELRLRGKSEPVIAWQITPASAHV
jgi:adenylate cyclase